MTRVTLTIFGAMVAGLSGIGHAEAAQAHKERATASNRQMQEEMGKGTERPSLDQTGDQAAPDSTAPKTKGQSAGKAKGNGNGRGNGKTSRNQAAGNEAAGQLADTNLRIVSSIAKQLQDENLLEGSDVELDVRGDGVVTLSGMVPNDLVRRRMESVARTTTGVTTVNNGLEVVAGSGLPEPEGETPGAKQPAPDAEIPPAQSPGIERPRAPL
jgi:osmotically-inducible protein OsmY